ncbi:MAG: LacI family DNA-binding transcriptional regulator [Sphingomonas sp.]|uniref:LacI family DNA-binding transcriptional regulator n=1 Tax=Sphingomonas sp. TaxID=28214 RepID=UPI003F7FE10F
MSDSVHPTSFDVAQLAMVSQSTVSRALRGDPAISQETRDRVVSAAAQLGYRPDARAVSLRARSVGCIAVVLLLPAGEERGALNPFYYDLVAAIEAAAARRGVRVLLSYQDAPDTLRADFERSREADGMIVIGSASNRDAWRFFADAHRAGGNIVAWGAPDDALPTVRADSFAGATLAVEHLVAKGRRRIAFVGPGWRAHHAYGERRRGYLAAIAQAGLSPVEGAADATGDRIEQGSAAVAALLQSGTSFDAIFAASDALAIGAAEELRSAGICIPEDVAIVGFDGGYGARHFHPPLTTIEQDVAIAGDLMVATLTARDAADTSLATPVPARLTVRASSDVR